MVMVGGALPPVVVFAAVLAPLLGRLLAVQSYYRWRKMYGGMPLKGFPLVKADQAKKFKDLELENARLKKLVADLSLREVMLQEVIKGNF
jgi:hypothetical protein